MSKEGTSDFVHTRCGAVLAGRTEPPEDERDCPVCLEVRETYRRWGWLRATAGTPLFEELGGRAELGRVGVVGK